MKIYDGKPNFKPLIIQLDTIEEVQKIDCLVNFAVANPENFKMLCNWFSSYYQGEEPFDMKSFKNLLENIEEETTKRLK